MKKKRIYQISEEVRRSISEIIQYQLKDPRIPSIISVPHVDVTNDLSYAKVFVSVLGDEETQEQAIEGINSAKGFIKKELSKRVRLRVMPELLFINDNSIEESMRLSKLIDEVNNEEWI